MRGSRYSQRIPSLDGVRGVAILLVLVLHFTMYGGWRPDGLVEKAYFALASGGWIGVDLFFVLSGFLITGILFDTKESPTFFRSFYARRILRIFPLYYGTLAVAFFVLPLLTGASAVSRALQDSQGWYWAYLMNVKVALDGWEGTHFLGHFWSLAVEEQFYLLWPFVVFASSRRTLIRICYACFAGAFFLRAGLASADFAIPGHPVLGQGLLPAYVLMPTRMDALAAGALVALYRRDPTRAPSLRRPLGVLVASGLLLFGLLLHLRGFPPVEGTVSTLGYSVLAVFFAAGIDLTLSSSEKGVLDRALSFPALRFLGRYSYALYVIHHPVVLWMRDSPFAVSEMPRFLGSQLPAQALYFLICLGVSTGLALLSWHLLENPFLRLKSRFPYGRPVVVLHPVEGRSREALPADLRGQPGFPAASEAPEDRRKGHVA